MPKNESTAPGVTLVERASSIEVYITEPALTHMQLPNLEGRSSEAASSMNVIRGLVQDIMSKHDTQSPEGLSELKADFDELANDVGRGDIEGITFPNEPHVPGESEEVNKALSKEWREENLQRFAGAIRNASDDFVESIPFISADSIPDYIAEGLLPGIEGEVYSPEDPWASLSFSLDNGDLVDFSHNIPDLDKEENSQLHLARVSLGLAASGLTGEQKDNFMALKRPDMDLSTANRMLSLGKKKGPTPTP